MKNKDIKYYILYSGLLTAIFKNRKKDVFKIKKNIYNKNKLKSSLQKIKKYLSVQQILCILMFAIPLLIGGFVLKYQYFDKQCNNQESIPVFLATDNKYAPLASIMMRSVLMNTNSSIDFYVMDTGIHPSTKELIKKDLKEFNHKKLHFIDMKQFKLKQFFATERFTEAVYARYFIPKIAPNLKKAIYLDSDIIVKKDIKILYNQDMEDYPIAALSEKTLGNGDKHIKRMMTVYPSYKGKDYFNSGVLLIDVPKLNQMNFLDKAVTLTKKYAEKMDCRDQDILNIIFENNFKKLDPMFNIMNSEISKFKRNSPKIQIDPIIIHFTWKPKPLGKKDGNIPFQQDFNNVLRKSIFYQIFLKKYSNNKL